MKLRLLIFETKSPSWVEQARAEYLIKLKAFVPFEIKLLKSPKGDRDSAEIKRASEAELLMKQIEPSHQLILFDEGGTTFKNSEEFSKILLRQLESGKNEIVFCIGGPYGFDSLIKKRAQGKWSLSGLTMNHWVAQITALEQLYRGMTIIKGLPYHNR